MIFMAIHWTIDPAHSQIQFKVKHLMISTVTGTFKTFDGTAETATEHFSTAQKIEFDADINSIDTNNAQRDEHLKSSEFFNADGHKQLHFIGTKYEAHEEEATLTGELTIKGVTKPVVLQVAFNGLVVDPYGQTKAGFTVNGKISRKEFGLTWNAVTEAGSVVVSDDVKIHAEVQFVKRA